MSFFAYIGAVLEIIRTALALKLRGVKIKDERDAKRQEYLREAKKAIGAGDVSAILLYRDKLRAIK